VLGFRRLSDAAQLAATLNEIRLERLAAKLKARGPLAVRDTIVRRNGDRVWLYLDDDSVLRLRMFWPRRQIVAALLSVRWSNRIGWVVVVRTTAGEEVTDYAWLATLRPLAPWEQLSPVG
jgi:hypothetical protein